MQDYINLYCFTMLHWKWDCPHPHRRAQPGLWREQCSGALPGHGSDLAPLGRIVCFVIMHQPQHGTIPLLSIATTLEPMQILQLYGYLAIRS